MSINSENYNLHYHIIKDKSELLKLTFENKNKLRETDCLTINYYDNSLIEKKYIDMIIHFIYNGFIDWKNINDNDNKIYVEGILKLYCASKFLIISELCNIIEEEVKTYCKKYSGQNIICTDLYLSFENDFPKDISLVLLTIIDMTDTCNYAKIVNNHSSDKAHLLFIAQLFISNDKKINKLVTII